MRIFTLLIVIGLLIGAHGQQSFAAAKDKEVWMCHGKWEKFVGERADWDFVKANLDGFQFFIDKLTKADIDQLRELGEILKKNNIATSVELGGLLRNPNLDDTVGEKTAAIELKKLSSLKKAGIELNYINLDGPIRRVMRDPIAKKWKTIDSLEVAVNELIDYMRLVREEHPAVKFLFNVNFPNYGYKGEDSYTYWGAPRDRMGYGDFHTVITTSIRMAKEAGIPLTGVTMDFPYDYTEAQVVAKWKGAPDPTRIDWYQRILDLEADIRKEGIEFGIIFNSQAGGKTSGEAFYNDTLAFIEKYHARGGDPDRYLIESWYPHPKSPTPEDAPYTMTYLVKEVIERIKKQ